MYKAAYAVIGNDKVLIKTFLFDEENTILDDNELDLLNVFFKNPKIVDISDLGYIPKIGTSYMNQTFMSTDENKERPLPDQLNENSVKLFSLIVENKHAGIYGFSVNSENGVEKAAIMSSDPVIQVETISE